MYKVAAYLDEAGDDPVSACKVLTEQGIHNVVLRYTWAGKNICDIPSDTHQRMAEIISDKKVIAVISEAGNVPAHIIFKQEKNLRQAFEIAKYYRAAFVRISCGTNSQHDVQKQLNEWLSLITDLSISSNIIPLLEASEESYHNSPASLATLLSTHKRIRLLYDPVKFILKRKLNPFIKYWALLKSFISAVDVRDIKIGKGFVAPGSGDAGIINVINDLDVDKQWLFLEPSFGRRHQDARTKADSFSIAYTTLKNIIAQI